MLKTRGLYEDSVIVVLSDHGDEFYEHGRFNHGHSLYDELIRVPLLIRFPGGAFGGRRIATPVELIDVVPTVLDFLGHPMPDDLDGTSAWPLVQRGPDEEPQHTARYAISAADGVGIAIRSATHKLIRTEAGDAFYSLLDDPGETRDVHDPTDPRVQALVRLLEAHLASRGDPLPPQSGDPDGPAPLDPGLEDRLRALGYLE